MRKPNAVIVFFGPPGAGKGTQAARLSAALGIPAISTGEMLRQASQSHSQLGEAVESVMASGKLVSDDLINQVVAERLARPDCQSGCILDGYPRTAPQASFLEKLVDQLGLSQPVVFNFDLACQTVIERLVGRRQCPVCGSIFNVKLKLGQKLRLDHVRCNRDGALLIQRGDDNPRAIRQRLALYRVTSAELIDFYRSRDYHEINAARPPDQVAEDVLVMLGTRIPPSAVPQARRPVSISALA